MARWVIHESELDKVDTLELRKKLAEDIRDDAKAIVQKGTGRTEENIHVEISGDSVQVVADAAREQKGGPEHYDAYIEVGSRDIPAKPFLRPATYKYRSPS